MKVSHLLYDPAFPQNVQGIGEDGRQTTVNYLGLSRREWFAGMALQGLLINKTVGGITEATEFAYMYADEMLRIADTDKKRVMEQNEHGK